MKLNKLALLLGAMLSLSAMADTTNTSAWYVGGGLGKSHLSYNSDDFRVNPNIAAAGYTASTYNKNGDTSFDVYAGYRLNKTWSTKLEYTNFGKENWGYNISGGNANSDLKINAVALSAVATLPIVDKFSALGEAGLYRYAATRTPSHSGTVVPLTSTPTETTTQGIKPVLALGLQYEVTGSTSVIGKYSYYGTIGSSDTVGRMNLSNYSLNLQYSF